jgi:hypothetical protein
MEYPNPNIKAIAVKKFILAYYPNVNSVEITYYTEDVPKLTVYYEQEDKRIANDYLFFQNKIIEDIKKYFGFKVISPHMSNWQSRKPEFQNPDMYVDVSSMNYDPFWRENEEENN